MNRILVLTTSRLDSFDTHTQGSEAKLLDKVAKLGQVYIDGQEHNAGKKTYMTRGSLSQQENGCSLQFRPELLSLGQGFRLRVHFAKTLLVQS